MLLRKAKGGLGNRMLSAASAILYANATKRRWYVDWTDGIYANKPENAYTLMFHNESRELPPREQEFISTVPARWSGSLDCSPTKLMSQYFPKDHSNPLVYRKMSAPLTAQAVENQLEVFWSYTSKFGRIKAFLPYGRRDRDTEIGKTLKRYFQPCNDIKEQVEALSGRAEGNILGVHIRYTDLKVPIQKVLSLVKTCMASGNFTTLFLATDSEYAERLFKLKFDNVLTNDKRFSNNNRQLHKLEESDQKLDDSYAALVDMMMLARCNALIYCSRSTFSETSRLLGQFDKDQLFDLDRFNFSVRFKRFIQEYL
jgi:hypothetical protein